jgi:hypothetical protein
MHHPPQLAFATPSPGKYRLHRPRSHMQSDVEIILTNDAGLAAVSLVTVGTWPDQKQLK